MKTTLDCIPCLLRGALESVRLASPHPRTHERIMRELLRVLGETSLEYPPPFLSQSLHRRLRILTGVEDPYRAAKDEQNRLALRFLDDMRDGIDAAADPLITAVRLAIAGNIIDLGVKTGIENKDIQAALIRAAEEPITGDIEDFRTAVGEARSILYLADNAGEIVFDRLLVERLSPARVTLAVRGKPVINDATIVDARDVGLHSLVEVIENGSDAPGTILADCRPEFVQRFHAADLVLAKGQGNFETLSQARRDVFFLFHVKCPVIADHVGLPTGTNLLRHHRG
ncbi:MAG: ARMT1-like domain-containing protein [Pseudomonadota bacterium]|nr:ARMT1-like domain-containing protein [Pseudomonadota bacterium]